MALFKRPVIGHTNPWAGGHMTSDVGLVRQPITDQQAALIEALERERNALATTPPTQVGAPIRAEAEANAEALSRALIGAKDSSRLGGLPPGKMPEPGSLTVIEKGTATGQPRQVGQSAGFMLDPQAGAPRMLGQQRPLPQWTPAPEPEIANPTLDIAEGQNSAPQPVSPVALPVRAPQQPVQPTIATQTPTPQPTIERASQPAPTSVAIGSAPPMRAGFASVDYTLGPKRPHRPNQGIVDIASSAAASVFGPGARVNVYSGRQDADKQYGSKRHNTGDAIDIRVYDGDGKIVGPNHPQRKELLRGMWARGARGIGSGPEYMGAGIHVDTVGTKFGGGHVWGSQAKEWAGEIMGVDPVEMPEGESGAPAGGTTMVASAEPASDIIEGQEDTPVLRGGVRDDLVASMRRLGRGNGSVRAPRPIPVGSPAPITDIASTRGIVAEGPGVRSIAFTPDGGREGRGRQRALADALVARGAYSRNSIETPLQGLAHLSDVAVGGLAMRGAQASENAAQERLVAALMGARGGGSLDALYAEDPRLAMRLEGQRAASAAAAAQRAEDRRWDIEDREDAQAHDLAKRDRFEPVLDDEGNRIGDRNLTTGRTLMDRRPDSVTVNNGQGKMPDKVLGYVIDESEKVGGVADSLASIEEARAALNSPGGTITGVFASQRLGVAKMISALGGGDMSQVENTEVLRAALASQTLEATKQMTGVLTDRDIQFLQDAVGGRIEINEGAMRRVLDMSETIIRARADRHNTRIDQFGGVYPDMAEALTPFKVALPERSLPSGREMLAFPEGVGEDEQEAYLNLLFRYGKSPSAAERIQMHINSKYGAAQ